MMKYTGLSVLLICVICLGCSEQNPSSTASTVYVIGKDGGRSVYWKDGVEVVVSDEPALTVVGCISGNDIYLGANLTIGGKTSPVYYKNDTRVVLPFTGSGAIISSIFVSGTDVYASGWQDDAPVKPLYWKNGTLISLPFQASARANDIFVSGTDVYVSGVDGSAAVYWKNGSEVILPASSMNPTANDIFVSGNDLYILGFDDIGVLWKNGVATQFALSGGLVFLPSVVFASGTDLYLGGVQLGPSTSVPASWKNGTLTAGSSTNVTVSSMFIRDQDTYLAGFLNTSKGTRAAYWKNNTLVSLPSSTDNSIASYVYVK